MKNKNLTYVKVQKGDMLLLIPTERQTGFIGLDNEILWSLKEFDFKVFGYLDVELVISSIMKEKAIAGLPFYDIDMDMYDVETYPDIMESLFKNRWDYAVMRQTYRYFDQLLKNYPDKVPSTFVVSCRWNNNSHDALQIYPLNNQYQRTDENQELAIQFSSYSEYSEAFIEDLIVTIGKCSMLPKNYEEFVPIKKEEILLTTEHLIKK